MKAVSLVTRRSDLSRAAFRAYYETTHSALAMQYFPFVGYTRNHLLDHPELDFDCISEFEAPAEMAEVDIMNSGSRQRVAADEVQFMDPTCIRVAGVRPHALVVPAAAVDAQRLSRRVLLIEHDQQNLLDRLQQLVGNLIASSPSLHALRLDLLDNDPHCPLPCNALLWLDMLEPDAPLPAALAQLPGLSLTLRVACCDTPPATLRERFVAFHP